MESLSAVGHYTDSFWQSASRIATNRRSMVPRRSVSPVRVFLFIWTGAGYKYYCYHTSPRLGHHRSAFFLQPCGRFSNKSALCSCLSTGGTQFRSSSVLFSIRVVLRSNVTRQRSFLVGAANQRRRTSSPFLANALTHSSRQREKEQTLCLALVPSIHEKHRFCSLEGRKDHGRRTRVIIDLPNENRTVQEEKKKKKSREKWAR